MKDLYDADIIFEQIDTPLGRWCDTGHQAPELFGYAGPEYPPEPTRFFLVKHKEGKGIYCELCLIIANRIAREKKANTV